jgi:hypothetical protein
VELCYLNGIQLARLHWEAAVHKLCLLTPGLMALNARRGDGTRPQHVEDGVAAYDGLTDALAEVTAAGKSRRRAEAQAATLAQRLSHESAARKAGEVALGQTQSQLEDLMSRCVRLTHKETLLSSQLRCGYPPPPPPLPLPAGHCVMCRWAFDRADGAVSRRY